MNSLDSFFNPKSIAIIGVSENRNKLGSVILSNLKDARYEGKIYPINPKHSVLGDLESYKTVKDVPGDIDIACIAIPPQFVESVIDECIKKGVKHAVIITAGFGEINEEGRELENRLSQKAKDSGMRILGPNCLGMITPLSKVNISFAASNAQEGNVAFLSQSGAFCTAMLDMSLIRNLGFSHFVSVGNKSDINELDLIKYFNKNDKVKVIGAYLEEIDSGQELIQLAKKSEKPLIVFKPGETQEAKKAISSHTGSLAGESQTVETAFEQAGIIQAKRVNQMFNLMVGFSWGKIPKGNRVAIVTNAGGPGIIATDDLIKNGLKLAEISEDVQKEMAATLPPTASVHNPIDVIGDALAERYEAPLNILLDDDNVDAILVILTPQLVTQIEETAKLILRCSEKTDKPIIPVFLGGKHVAHGIELLSEQKVPAFKYISTAVDLLSNMYKHGQYLKKQENEVIPSLKPRKTKGIEAASKKIDAIITEEQEPVSEDIVVELAEEFGIDLPKQSVVTNIEDAIKFSEGKYPVIIKPTTSDLVHKTEMDSVYLDIRSKEELTEKFNELITNLDKHAGIKSPNILVQEFITGAVEVFIGVNRDGGIDVYEPNTQGFGHLLAFGQGGIYTEVYKDIKYSLTPTSREQIESEFNKTKIYEILSGARGKDALAVDKVIETVENIQKMVLAVPQISSLDINPLLVTKDRAIAVDIKMFINK